MMDRDTPRSAVIERADDDGRLANGAAPPPPWWIEAVACVVLVVAAFLLRFHGLEKADLTEDETMSTCLPVVTYGSLFTDSAGRPPLIFVIQKATMQLLGRSGPFEIRLPSVIEGALGVLALYLFARSVCGSRVALLSAAFLCLSHFHFFWSRDGRYYPMLTLMGILFLWSFWGIVERQRLLMAPFALLTGLALILTHYVGLLLLTATALTVPVFLLSRHWRSVFWFHRQAILFAAAATVIVTVLTVPIWDQFVRKAFDMAGRNSTAALPAFFDVTPHFLLHRIAETLQISVPCAYGVVTLMLFGFLWTLRHQPRLALVWFSVSTVPFAVLWLFRPSHWWHPKYFIFMLPVLLILIVCGILWATTVSCRIIQYMYKRKTTVWAQHVGFLLACLGVGALCVPNVSAILKDYAHPNQDMQKLAALLTQSARDGDQVRYSWLEGWYVLRNYCPRACDGQANALLDPTKPFTRSLKDVPCTWYLHTGKMSKSHMLSEAMFSPRLSRMAFSNTFLAFGPNLQHVEFGRDYPGTPDPSGVLEISPGESQFVEVLFPLAGRRAAVVGEMSGASSLSLAVAEGEPVRLLRTGNVLLGLLDVPEGRSTLTVRNTSDRKAAVSFVEILSIMNGQTATIPAWDFCWLSGDRLLDTIWLEKTETGYLLRDMRSGHAAYYRFFSAFEGTASLRVRALNDPPGANRYTVSVEGATPQPIELSFDREDGSLSSLDTPPIALRQGVYTICVRYEGLPFETMRRLTNDFRVMTLERMQTSGLESISIVPAGQ